MNMKKNSPRKEIVFSKRDELVFKTLAKQGPLGKRALFIFQYLFLRHDFRELVATIRKRNAIPKDGFDRNRKDHRDVVLSKYLIDFDYVRDVVMGRGISLPDGDLIEEFVDKCGILSYVPRMDLADGFITAIIREYVLLNDFVGLYKGRFALTAIDTFDLEEVGDNKQCEFRIMVPISAKKEEIIDYIKTQWRGIEIAKEDTLKRRDFVRFRPSPNFIRDIKIFNKYLEIKKLSKQQKKDQEIGYIELAVIKELKKEGLKNVPSDGAIRSIVSRLSSEINYTNGAKVAFKAVPLS